MPIDRFCYGVSRDTWSVARHMGALIYDGLAAPVGECMMLGDNPPPLSCLRTKSKDLASRALDSCFVLDASATSL